MSEPIFDHDRLDEFVMAAGKTSLVTTGVVTNHSTSQQKFARVDGCAGGVLVITLESAHESL